MAPGPHPPPTHLYYRTPRGSATLLKLSFLNLCPPPLCNIRPIYYVCLPTRDLYTDESYIGLTQEEKDRASRHKLVEVNGKRNR
jgi:hypothetical protein